jgi:hypothetical protein
VVEVIANEKMKEEALHEAFASAMSSASGAFHEREVRAMKIANELVRHWLGGELERMADRYGDEVTVDDAHYRRHSSGTRRYHTLCGPVEVRRDTFRLVGIHNGPTVVPLEIEAGIFDNATPALALSVTHGFAERPLRHYEAEMQVAHRCVPSRSTLERIGKRIGARIQQALPRIEPIVRAFEEIPVEARSISIGLDRTTVPMAEPAETTNRHRDRPYVRRPPAPISVHYRMAYVGTVAIHDANGETLISKRFAATANEDPVDLMNRVGQEVLRIRAERRGLPLTVVQDGAPELWKLVDNWLEHRGLTAIQVIDRFHVDERLARLCEAIAADAWQARNLYQRWMVQLDRSDTAIDRICRSLNRLATYHNITESDGAQPPSEWNGRARQSIYGERANIAWDNLAYLERQRRYLRYATSIRRGLTIGSGVTEGACKSVVMMRFKRSGQRWHEHGLSPCLQLRALHLNARLRPCFDLISTARKSRLRAA